MQCTVFGNHCNMIILYYMLDIIEYLIFMCKYIFMFSAKHSIYVYIQTYVYIYICIYIYGTIILYMSKKQIIRIPLDLSLYRMASPFGSLLSWPDSPPKFMA